jgi:hypothetical protein
MYFGYSWSNPVFLSENPGTRDIIMTQKNYSNSYSDENFWKKVTRNLVLKFI